MIVCVAGNPSIDKLFTVERLEFGAIHRPVAFLQVPGGKGLNVARAAHSLGAEVVAACILGGHTGRWVEEALEAEGLRGRFVRTRGGTRSSVSVADRETWSLTEFYEDGTPLEPGDWEALELCVVEILPGARWATLSGSLPPGAPVDGYARLVWAAREAGVACALDTRGPALAEGLRAGPDLVKVNAAEAGEVLGTTVATELDALAAAQELRALAGGRGAAVVTRGEEGAVLVAPDGSAWRGRLYVRGPYPVGSGDAFLAGMVTALERGQDWPAALHLALGAATANAEVPGAGRLERARAEELAGRAEVGPAHPARRGHRARTPPPPTAAFDMLGTFFSLDAPRRRLVELGAPPHAMDLWFAQAGRDALALFQAGGYVPLREVLVATLPRTLARFGLEAEGEAVGEATAAVLAALDELEPAPDASEACAVLTERGWRLVALTNGSEGWTRALLRRAGLLERFGSVLSADRVRKPKPHPDVYALARSEATGELWLVAAHAFDVLGAARAGLKTAWVAAGERSYPAVFPSPDLVAPTLLDAARAMTEGR